jgi:hypothetical protein
MKRLGFVLVGGGWFVVVWGAVNWLLWRVNLLETTGDSSMEAAAIARFRDMFTAVAIGLAAACVGALLWRIGKRPPGTSRAGRVRQSA